jgi:hypothetical protein
MIEKQFQTHPVVCKYMVDLIPPYCRTVLEPTPGEGNLVRELQSRERPANLDLTMYRKQFEVTAAEDFFLLDTTKRYDAIVMNPPFSGKSLIINNAPEGINLSGMAGGYHILNECMKMSDHVIALMPWFLMLDSDTRSRHLINFGLKSITALPRKSFNYLRIQTMILELEKGYTGPTEYKYFTHPTWKI